jgi:3D (Asp-Asp-Asp) domain-containing protein
MKNLLKFIKKRKKYLLLFMIGGIFIGIFPIFESKSNITEAAISNPSFQEGPEKLVTVSQNSFLPIINPQSVDSQIKTVNVVITAYSSSPWETDDNPFITASGEWVKDGIIANNLLPFGTKVRIPELYGDKIFVVEDRMHWRKGYYHVDIWFPSYWEALDFGTKRSYIEILES